ncbi:translocation/assembly module TamB domain-containing protein [Salinibius halmophilus]|uniref:translocation/assembly module TamB domain-containing protein n=1 Tax=Salinibius halmophilus TaxID=1853216 RepID=UPI000E66950F|nr:translocation/assembly module TamB domain-containing protein [Salinibius halmophilus]
MIVRWLVIKCLQLLLLLVLIITATLGWLNHSERARIQLVEHSVALINRFTGQTIRFSHGHSSHLGHWSLSQISVTNAQQHISIDQLEIDWHWFELLNQGLVLDQLRIEQVTITSNAPSSDSQLPSLVDIWASLPRMQINQFAVQLNNSGNQISLTGSIATHQPSFAGRGSIGASVNEQNINLSFHTLDGDEFWLNIEHEQASLSGHLRPRGDWRLAIEQLEGSWENNQGQFSGVLSLAVGLDQLQIDAGTLLLNGQPASLNGFIGAEDSELRVVAEALDLAPIQRWLPELSGQLSVNGYLVNGWQQLAFDGYLDIFGELYEQPLDFYSQTTANTNVISVETAQARWGESLVSLSGDYRIAEQTLSASLDWQNVSDQQWHYWVKTWPGDLTLTTQGALTWQGKINDLTASGGASAFGRYQNSPIKISISDALLDFNQITLNAATLQSDNNQLDLTGKLNWRDDYVEFAANDLLLADTLVRQFVALPNELTFAIAGELSGSGPITQPAVTAKLSANSSVMGEPIAAELSLYSQDLQAFKLNNLSVQNGNAQASGVFELSPLSAELDVQLNNFGINPNLVPNIEQLNVSLSDIFASGDITTRWQNNELDAAGSIQLSAQVAEQPLRLNWQGSGSWPSSSQHRIELNYSGAQAQLAASIDNRQLTGELAWQSLSADLLRGLAINLPKDIQGASQGTLTIAGPIDNPQLSIDATAEGMLVSFDTPWLAELEADASANDWQLTQLSLAFGEQGALSATGTYNHNTLAIESEFRIPELAYWLGEESQLQGSLLGGLSVQGSPAQPEINSWLNWRSSRFDSRLNSAVVTTQNQYQLVGELLDSKGQRIQLTIATPVQPLALWADNWQQHPFEASLFVRSDSSVLAPIFRDRPEQDFQGLLAADLNINGTLASPSWQGSASIQDGYYANATYGSVVRDLDLDLSAQGLAVEVRANARDDNGGNLRLNGRINWPDQRPDWWQPFIDVRMNADEARLVRRTDIDATADGRLRVSGFWQDLTIDGDIDVAPLTIRIVESNNAVAQLNIVEETQANQSETTTEGDFAPNGQWQVTARTEQRAQLYMIGLVAELRGEVQVTDSLRTPVVGGQFSIVRGSYTAFGKVFTINSGTVQVQGNQINLDITARYTGPNINVDLRITGNQDRIELALSSDDGQRSSDEILTELLFGKRIEALTPIEAIELAAAVNSLRSTSQNLGLLGELDFFGLDALRVNPTFGDDNLSGFSLQAGKYLSNQIYLQVESNTNFGEESSTTGSLQWQITPNSNIELYTGETSGSGGLQFQWQREY